jgi:tetratricopeptide (TPR) repeat protein
MARPFLPKLLLARGAIARSGYDLDGADKLLHQALGLQDQLFGSNHPDRAAILSELANLEHWRNNSAEEERQRRAALQVTSQAFGPDDPRTLRFERELADMLVSQGKYPEASRLLEHVGKAEDQRQGLGNPSAETLQLRAQLEEHIGTIREAIALQSKALSLLRQQNQGDTKDLADAMRRLGMLFLQAGDVATAGPLLTDAHGMSVRLLPAHNPEIVLGLVSLAMVDQSKGDLTHAHLLLRQALDHLPADPEASRRLAALVKLNIGLTYTKQSNPKAAEPYLAESKVVAEGLFGGAEIIVAETSRNLGVLLVERGDYAKAEPNLTRALEIYSRLNPRSADTARTAMALGLTLLIRGDAASAEGLFREALARMGPDGGALLAALTNGLALTLMEKGGTAEAEAQLQRAIEIATQSQEKTYSLAAESLYQLGNFRLRAGDSKQADIFWSRAEEMARREVDPDHPIIAYVLEARAQLLAKGTPAEKEEAIKLASEAVRILSDRLGGDHPLVAEAWNVRAMSEWSAGRLAAARSSLETEARLEAANFTRQLVLREEGGYQKLLNNQSPTDLYVSFHLLGMPGDQAAARLAFEAILQRKGTFQDVLAEHARLQHEASGGTELFERWTEAERKARECGLSNSPLELASLPSGPGGACAKDAISLANEAGLAYRALVEKVPGFNAKPVALPDLAARLHAFGDYSLVEIVQFTPVRLSGTGDLSPRYTAYILSPLGRIDWVDLGPQDKIDELADQVRKLESDPKSDLETVHKAARSLDALVMQPVRAKLGDRKKLFIAADGNLNLIDFSSFVDEDRHELIEHYMIAGLTSGRDLLRLPLAPPSHPAQKDFLFTDPAFLAAISPARSAAVSDAAQLGSGQPVLTCEDAYLKRDWTAISFSSERLSKWRASLPGIATYSGEDANKNALKAIETPRSVWLLTHGFFCSNSSEGDSAGLWEDPMQRAALALAGASASSLSARRNGYVTAGEISQLHWQGAELVVLGACETALGAPSVGDGVHGLRRALTLAGARTQVMTLWQVSGPQTFDILQGFAEHVAGGQDRLSALRTAQLEVRGRKPDATHNYAHPYYWAGIYFMGDPRPLPAR